MRTLQLPMPVGRDPPQLMPHRMQRLRAPRLQKAVGDKPAAAPDTVAAVKLRLAVEPRTATALTSNLSMQHQAAELTGSAALHCVPSMVDSLEVNFEAPGCTCYLFFRLLPRPVLGKPVLKLPSI